MPRECSICANPSRPQIDAAIRAGLKASVVSRQFGVSDDSLGRHRGHMQAGSPTRPGADELVTQVRQLHSKAVSLLLAAEKVGDLRGAIGGIREAARTLELMGKLQGQIGQGDTTINITTSQVFVTLQQTIMMALEQFPEARQAVVQALAGQKMIEG